MSRIRRTMERILTGAADANLAFADLRALLLHLGFGERIRGSHHIYYKDGIEEILNLQPKQGQAKPYQVKQVRKVILRHRMGGAIDERQV